MLNWVWTPSKSEMFLLITVLTHLQRASPIAPCIFPIPISYMFASLSPTSCHVFVCFQSYDVIYAEHARCFRLWKQKFFHIQIILLPRLAFPSATTFVPAGESFHQYISEVTTGNISQAFSGAGKSNMSSPMHFLAFFQVKRNTAFSTSFL